MSEEQLKAKVSSDLFAPSKESVRITYKSPKTGKATDVRLTITDASGTKVHEESQTAAKGLPDFVWDGSLSVLNDPKEPFASPLRSPYTIAVVATVQTGSKKPPERPSDMSDKRVSKERVECSAAQQAEDGQEAAVSQAADSGPIDERLTAQVKVLYHSVELRRGAWIATGGSFGKGTDEWRGAHLNELGYHAGPCENRDTTSFDKAKNRYEATRVTNNNLPNQDDALERGDNTIPWLTYMKKGKFPWSAKTETPVREDQKLDGLDLRVVVEAIGYTADYANDRIDIRDQYTDNTVTKHAREASILNRPSIPLEIVVYLKNKKKQPVEAPEAVGKLRIDWKLEDREEDYDRLFPDANSTSSFSRRYVQKVFKSLGKKNCPTDCGGIAEATGSWRSGFWIGDQYKPYTTVADDPNQLVYSRTSDDRAQNRALGRAGTLLRLSLIAGDRYKLTAKVRFEGNRAQELERDNGELKAETGNIEVWRRAEVAYVIGWPRRPELKDPVWKEVREEYYKAYHDIDISTLQDVVATDIISQTDYAEWVDHCLDLIPTKKDDRRPLLDITLDDGSPVKPNRGHIDSGNSIIMLGELDDVVNKQLFGAPIGRLGGTKKLANVLLRAARSKRPRGIIVCCSGPWELAVDYAKARYRGEVKSVTSEGMRDQLVILDTHTSGKLYYIVSHEIGHTFWLSHYKIGGAAQPDDHDRGDDNCMMSYPDDSKNAPPHRSTATYAPHFCGKCNLKLRGWNVRAASMPGDSS